MWRLSLGSERRLWSTPRHMNLLSVMLYILNRSLPPLTRLLSTSPLTPFGVDCCL